MVVQSRTTSIRVTRVVKAGGLLAQRNGTLAWSGKVVLVSRVSPRDHLPVGRLKYSRRGNQELPDVFLKQSVAFIKYME